MTDKQYLTPLELFLEQPLEAINSSVIWLHGLGADGHDFEPIVKLFLRPDGLPNTRFILPHAPDMPVTRNHGYVMPAWYDVYGIIPISREDEAGIYASQQYIQTLIEKEINRGIPSHRIVLAGFSQGGAIALHTGIRYPNTLGGIIALSTYLPLQSKFAQVSNSSNRHTPIFMAHGIYDDIISIDTAKTAYDTLKAGGYNIQWLEYGMAHSVNQQEISDIENFLHQILD